MRTRIQIIGLAATMATAAFTFAGSASAQAAAPKNATSQQMTLPKCTVQSPVGGLLGLNIPILSATQIGKCL